MSRSPPRLSVLGITGLTAYFGLLDIGKPQPGETVVVSGDSRLAEQVAGETFLLSPTAFFQTSVDAAEVLTRLVLDAVPSSARPVLDLYAGCGLFSQPLARRGLDVVAVGAKAQAIAAGGASRDAAGPSPEPANAATRPW